PGDYETLRHNFNRALARLSQTLSDLDRTAGGIDGEVVAVAEAADELSRRTERNAATLEQTAAALDELTSSVRSAAAGATEARRLIESANRNADDGGVSVAHAVEAMNRIEEASRGIAKITGVIDEIAFQTNLLALNAGVEAARAGEAGRGFAVVASEVRALAQRSSEAAREISDMIAASETEIRQGVDLVGKTGVALDRILDSVRDISAQVMVIATSSEEQAIGLGEINNAVNQLDTATQQNAAMFEETSAATTVLNAKTRDLVAAIRRFEFDGTAAPAARAAQTASEVAGRAVA
ncbi:MAG: methyl-accepting chemotaxis protein, partial [Maritimibacter sp.]|nr:methyl-accepting chemotaxis protein [Maritimibacter sp.]